MPELPEVETIRRQLATSVVGHRILHTQVQARIIRPSAEALIADTEGATIHDACRHGKQLYFPLEGGRYLFIHLGMSGYLEIRDAGELPYAAAAALSTPHPNPPPQGGRGQASPQPSPTRGEGAAPAPGLHHPSPITHHGNPPLQGGREVLPRFPQHVRATFALDDGRRLVFTDPRTFGVIETGRDLSPLARLGPDPTAPDFDAAAVAARMHIRHTAVKSALLDQRMIAGLGNIYADELCFLNRVHPASRACDVPRQCLVEMLASARGLLDRAVGTGGATLRDGMYRDVFGRGGEFRPFAYGRHGEPCALCGARIERGRLGSGRSARSYHFCPRCQPPG